MAELIITFIENEMTEFSKQFTPKLVWIWSGGIYDIHQKLIKYFYKNDISYAYIPAQKNNSNDYKSDGIILSCENSASLIKLKLIPLHTEIPDLNV